MVVPGFAVTAAPVVALKPVAGVHEYVPVAPAPPAVRTVDEPAHMDTGEGLIVMVGRGFTVTVDVAVFWQPLISLSVTVYTFVAAGFAVTVAPVVALKPAAGDHEYVPVAPAPPAVSTVDEPVHIDGLFTVIVGRGLTVTVDEAVFDNH